MSSPRMARISASPSFSKSRPSKNISPPTMRPGGETSRMIESAVTDLPQPDSPTRLNVSPRSSVNETSSTDRTSPRLVEKNVFRLRTSRRLISNKREYYNNRHWSLVICKPIGTTQLVRSQGPQRPRRHEKNDQ